MVIGKSVYLLRALTLILVSLMALTAVCVRPIEAQYQSVFTIAADGSINPSTAPIKQAGETYILTSDLARTIALQRNNTIFDGNGYTLSGSVNLNSVENVTVKNLNITGSAFGINLENTTNVTVANNTITETGKNVILPGPPVSMGNPTAGIFIYKGSSNIITGNNLMDNICGMVFLETSHNLIVENNVTGSHSVALDFYESSYNRIYHNSFINNTNIVEDDSFGFSGELSQNVWDNGFPSGGNYWSDYLTRYPKAAEIDSSGIGNTSYFVKPFNLVEPSTTMSSQARSYWYKQNELYKKNTDRYPLMKPFNEFYILTITPPRISLLSPLEETYDESNVSLVFTIDKTANWTGYSLDGHENVTINGNDTITNIPNGSHSITIYANDTFGNMATTTISFTISKPEPFPTTSAIAVSAATVAVMGLLVYLKKRKR
jgi:hypothetical protein